MNEMTPPPEPELQPFAGREALYARLYQYALDPPEPRAMVITGHTGTGKTALLKQFDHVFDDTILSLYVPLASLRVTADDDWLTWLIDETNTLLTRHDFSLYRLPDLDDDPDDDTASDTDLSLRAWVRDVYLPEVFRVIRSQRRLVWLLDDADVLLALDDEIQTSLLDYLHELLQTHEQLTLVMALPLEQEDHLPRLVPLVNPAETERLYPLSVTDTGVLMRQFAPGLSDEAVARIHQETGGQPLLLQRYGQALASVWQSKTASEALQTATTAVYDTSREDFRARWLQLERDERLVLTAIASLLYDRPDRAVTAKRIEKWLIETDFPLDVVAINAALRGLDYREIVRNSPQDVRLRSGFLQKWLIEHARLDDSTDAGGLSSGGAEMLDGRVIALLLMAALVLLLALLLLPGLPAGDPGSAVPTVTISGA
jgi:hypothetical protein